MRNDIIQTGTTVKVAFPLLSSIFGAGWNGNKYIPLDRLNSDLILEITFDDFRNGFKFWGKNTSAGAPYTAANTFYSTALPGVCNPANAVNHITIQNVQLVCQLVELDSATLGAYNSLHGSQIEIPVTQYRTYQTSMTAPLSSYSALVPARFQSVNALFHAFYDNVTVNSLTTGSNSWRTRAGLSSVAYRLGSLVYPPRPISCDGTGAEAFLELQKAIGAVSATKESSVAFLKNEWVVDGFGNASNGAFMLGQELSVFP